MSNLKSETLHKCLTILKEFIDESSGQNKTKGIATLALEQLERTTAGSLSGHNPKCIDTPLAGLSNSAGISDCLDTPLADGGPLPDQTRAICIDIPRASGG